MKSYYDLLGVAPNAAVADIEKAFFKLKALHPADKVASDQSIKFRFQPSRRCLIRGCARNTTPSSKPRLKVPRM
jgi:hypothetical protein